MYMYIKIYMCTMLAGCSQPNMRILCESFFSEVSMYSRQNPQHRQLDNQLCPNAAMHVTRPSSLSQAAAMAVNRTQGVKKRKPTISKWAITQNNCQ